MLDREEFALKRNILLNGDKVPKTIIKWTQQAKDCYKLHGFCFSCPIYEIIGEKCRMKFIIPTILETCGKPEEKTEEGNNEREKKHN